ncbi:hypothetical protein QQF64_034033 [Cirrhinus molitorella]|uniref:Uncharacterized protein n=1 Tax=Cirrhinus molitorella TaxID=172907 RepID=A0ABR3MVJ4_9TELE
MDLETKNDPFTSTIERLTERFTSIEDQLADLGQRSTPVVEPGYMIGVDLMGPFPRSAKQNEHLVTVDYCSKWVELFPLRKAKAPQITRILVEEIFTR